MKRMQRKALAVALALTCAISCEISVYSQTKETTIVERPDNDRPDQLKHILEIYPTEIYYGDVVFFSTYVENISNEIVWVESDLPPQVEFADRLMNTNCFSQQEYVWKLTDVFGISKDSPRAPKSYPPGKKTQSVGAPIEFPPLEDWNAPFWKEIREKLTPEGIPCQFRIEDRKHRTLFTQDILIKLRPEDEMDLLDKWFNDTPEVFFPQQRELAKRFNIPRSTDSVSDTIVINGEKYKQWIFARSTNFRKPYIPNFPTTLEGWKELDSKFCDSTLHDDIKYMRLLLEFFETDDENAERAKRELTEWLEALPELQKSFFIARLLIEGYYFQSAPLDNKYRALRKYYGLPEVLFPII